jgi:acetyl esterase/lipase
MGRALGKLAAPLTNAAVTEVDAGGVRALWVDQPGAGDRVLVYFHGGGYVMCSADTHVGVAGHLARRLGVRAFVVDYRLVPENAHPAPVEDCLQAYTWLLDSGVPASHIAFAGESAGGSLCVTTQVLAKDKGVSLPVAAAAMSPWVDLELKGASTVTNEDHDFAGTAADQERYVQLFLGSHGDRRDPLANPLYADLRHLPPLFVQVGGDEILRDDAVRLAERARGMGVEVNLDVVPRMQHMFELWAGVMPEADAALDRIADFLRPHLTTTD